MSPQDPIKLLEAHYAHLENAPLPDITLRRSVRWWEPVGGLAVGVAAVAIAAAICTVGSSSPAPPVRGLLEHQLRMAGIRPDEAAVPKRRAQREAPWHV